MTDIARTAEPGFLERVHLLRRRYTIGRVESMQDVGSLYLPDSLVNEVIDIWTAYFAEQGLADDAMLEFCIRDAHELAASGREWRP